MGLDLEYHYGQTPLDGDEKEGLLVNTIDTREELDEHEQLNIEKAVLWTLHRNFKVERILTVSFVKTLHKKMFDNVWKWAGKFRQSDKNLGVEWTKVSMELGYLLHDARYWIDRNTYPPDEPAIRFKHRLVSIHCFPNGNGRHSRIMADIIAESVFGKAVFSWSRSNMVKPDAIRKSYINALRQADNGNIQPLIDFSRS